MLKLTGETEGIIVGLLLSGAKFNISSDKSKNVRLVLGLPNSNFKYLWFIFFKLLSFCNSYPTYTKTRIYLYTRALPCFNKLYHSFYKNKNEGIIPINMYDLLTPVALAFWVLGSSVEYMAYGPNFTYLFL